MKVAEGVFPHGLMHEAKIHFLSIADNETVQMRQTQLNSGVAASTLSLLSQKKVKKKKKCLKKMSKNMLIFPSSDLDISVHYSDQRI